MVISPPPPPPLNPIQNTLHGPCNSMALVTHSLQPFMLKVAPCLCTGIMVDANQKACKVLGKLLCLSNQ